MADQWFDGPDRRALRALVLGTGGLAVGVASSAGPVRDLDRKVFRAVNAGHGPVSDAVLAGLTELGSLWAAAAAAAVLLGLGRTRAALRGIGAAATMWAAGQALKKMFLRVRPFDALPEVVRLLIARPQGTSWPSAHPATLVAFVTAAGRELELSPGPRTALEAVAGAVGLSRVYLGVHYPSDVIGGLLLGSAVGVAWTSDRQAREGRPLGRGRVQ